MNHTHPLPFRTHLAKINPDIKLNSYPILGLPNERFLRYFDIEISYTVYT
jgi:hypothetical protein